MVLVSGVDALWRVAHHKIFSEFEPRYFFQNRNAVFFGATRVNRRFKHHVVAFFEYLRHGAACAEQGFEVGEVGVVYGGRNGYNKKGSLLQVCYIGAKGNISVLKICGAELAAGVFTPLHLSNACGVDVKTNDFDALGKF